jgi:hypothetical protein
MKRTRYFIANEPVVYSGVWIFPRGMSDGFRLIPANDKILVGELRWTIDEMSQPTHEPFAHQITRKQAEKILGHRKTTRQLIRFKIDRR